VRRADPLYRGDVWVSVVRVVCCQVEFLRRADALYRGVVWMFVRWVCCVFLGRDLWDGLFPCTEESYGYLSVVSVVFFKVEVIATG